MRQPSSSSSSAAAAKGTGTGTSKTPCCSKVGMKRGPWTPEEDELLSNYINKEGEGRWRTLPKRAGLLRCGKSCRLRWMNYLRPSVKRGLIAPDEEDLILRLHRLLGNRWSLIAGRIPGRTDNEIKNYWNTHLSKKLISQGIDPRTHKPLSPNSSSAVADDKPSSSKANQIQIQMPPNPNPNLVTPPPPALQQPVSSSGRILINKGRNGYSEEANLGQYYHGEEKEKEGVGNGVLLDIQNNSDICGIGLGGSNCLGSNEDDDYEIDYGTNDVFSSFLNSLINEDVFNSQQYFQVQQQSNEISIAPAAADSSDPLIYPPPQSLAFVAGWDAPIMSAFNQNDPRRIHDHTEKQF